jgi:hypothetical protein
MKKTVYWLVLAVFFMLVFASCLDPSLDVVESLNIVEEDWGEGIYDNGNVDDDGNVVDDDDDGDLGDLGGSEDDEGYDPKQDNLLPLVKVTKVELDKSVLNLSVGEQGTLTATVVKNDPAVAVPVTWVSDDSDVATVKDNGNGTATVTGWGSGSVTVSAYAGGKRADCTVKMPFVAGLYSNGGLKLEQANTNLAGAFDWIKTNGASNESYVIMLGASENVTTTYMIGLGPYPNLSSTGATHSNVKVTLRGMTDGISIRKMNQGALFVIQGNEGDEPELTLEDITLEGNNNNNVALVEVGSNNHAGKLTMKAGSQITKNISSGAGGGVVIWGGSEFIMEGGLIDKNQSMNGGGVVSEGTFTMSGGTIDKNTTTTNGGGVYVASLFIMEGDAKILNNTAIKGGGVFVQNKGTFTMKGGSIEGNTAKTSGAAVCIPVFLEGQYAVMFTKTGGTIYGNGGDAGDKANKGSESNTVHAIEKLKNAFDTDFYRDATAWPGDKLDLTVSTGWSMP